MGEGVETAANHIRPGEVGRIRGMQGVIRGNLCLCRILLV